MAKVGMTEKYLRAVSASTGGYVGLGLRDRLLRRRVEYGGHGLGCTVLARLRTPVPDAISSM